MLSKARIKLIQSLNQKKHRNELKLFVVEGKKQVAELLTSDLRIRFLVATQVWIDDQAQLIKNNTEVLVVSEEELRKTSLLQAPQDVLAVVEIPDDPIQPVWNSSHFTLMLDGIRDPGNLGTMIRIADWYGITTIVCSNDCVDLYNPKTIQASMGSFIRVQVIYGDLEQMLTGITTPVYGALLDGTSLYDTTLTSSGVLLIGNEGKGISAGLLPYITHPVSIPKLGGAESLNAAIATAIFCDAMAREQHQTAKTGL